MNKYSFDDLYVGMTESFTVTITQQMMDDFERITGDNNPLHKDSSFAKDKGYREKVVYGMLTSSFLSTLAGVYLPGENSLIREVEVKMKRPVYVGNTIMVSGEISGINRDYKIFDMKVSMTNEDGEKVLRGKMQMGMIQ